MRIFYILLFTFALHAASLADIKKLYQHHQYTKAYNLTIKLLRKDYSSYQLNWYLVRIAQKLGKYKDALAAIDRILIYYPNDTQAQLAQAKIYFLMHDYASAKYYFDKLLSKTKSTQTYKTILNYIEQIKKHEKRDYLTFLFMTKVGYDSNVNNISKVQNYNLYFGDQVVNVTNPYSIEDSFSAEEVLVPNYTHKFDNFSFNNNILLMFKQYTSTHKNDFDYIKETPSLIFKHNKHTLITRLNYEYLNYDKHHYYSVYGAGVDWFRYFTGGYNQLTADIKNKVYQSELTSNQNATIYSINDVIALYHGLHTPSVLLGYTKSKGHDDSISTTFYDMYTLKLRDVYTKSAYSIDGYIKYDHIKYDREYTIFDTVQNDNKMSLSLTLTKKMRAFNVQVNYTYIKNNSNIEPFTYHKSTCYVGVLKSFKGL
ncbi:MAG: tetratricopeptide repeat protein [Epsilonproteobacteria bacterium]|nr:tetratricopeptide repeat protein [Campylobacterota bacterium]